MDPCCLVLKSKIFLCDTSVRAETHDGFLDDVTKHAIADTCRGALPSFLTPYQLCSDQWHTLARQRCPKDSEEKDFAVERWKNHDKASTMLPFLYDTIDAKHCTSILLLDVDVPTHHK